MLIKLIFISYVQNYFYHPWSPHSFLCPLVFLLRPPSPFYDPPSLHIFFALASSPLTSFFPVPTNDPFPVSWFLQVLPLNTQTPKGQRSTYEWKCDIYHSESELLGTIFSSSVCLPVDFIFFTVDYNLIVYSYYIFIIHSSADECLGCYMS